MSEPVEYQYRTRPDWIPEWNGWNTCSKESAQAYEKTPYLHDWHYEVRRLYITPPQRKEPEPVVWMYQDKSTHEVRFQKHMRGFVDHGATYETPLYTTPPAAQRTEQEPVACRTLCELCIKRGYNFCANAAKTTPITTPPAAQPVGQAPCAKHCESTAYEIVIRGLKGDIERLKAAQQEPVKFKCTVVDDQHPQGIPLEQWGDPPAAQRQWVELTDEEIQNCYGGNVDDFARALLAKSKERNT